MRDHHPQGPRTDHPQRQLYLSDQTSQWRTPSAGHKAKGASQPPLKRLAGGHTLDLQDQAKFWSTPQAHDAQGPKTPKQIEAMRLKNGAGVRNLNEDVDNWPTPRKSDMQADRPLTMSSTGTIVRQGNSDTFGANLADIAANFSSPPALAIPDGLSFWQRVRILLPLCRRLKSSLPSPYNKARSMFRRKLNPNFTDWLMGWPVGWSSGSESAGPDCKSVETASYLSNARRFLESFGGGSD
jgi:hypothetical protein